MSNFIQPPFWALPQRHEWVGHVSAALVTPPDGEPLTVDEAKLHLRVPMETPDEDALIAGYIASARAFVEKTIARALQTQTWDVFFDHLPPFGRPMYLPLVPLQSVSSITTIDIGGVVTTLDAAGMAAAGYLVDGTSEPARIGLNTGIWWPVNLRWFQAVQLRLVIGYQVVPSDILQALRWLVAHYYENRVAADVATRFDATLPLGVAEHLAAYMPEGLA